MARLSSSYAPSMEHSSRFLQNPVSLLRRASGRPLVDYRRKDGLGVLSSVATTPISAASSRTHVRAFCIDNYPPGFGQPAQPEPSSLLAEGRSKVKNALNAMKLHDRSSAAYRMAEERMLEGLEILEKLANEDHFCRNRARATILLVSAMSPHHHGVDVGACSNVVLEVSMRVTIRLLEAAPGEIGTLLRGHISRKDKVKTSMERIRDCDTCDAKMRALAEKILSQLP